MPFPPQVLARGPVPRYTGVRTDRGEVAEDTLTRAEEAALARARRTVRASTSGDRTGARRDTRRGSDTRPRSAAVDLARGAVAVVAATLLLAGDPSGLPAVVRPARGDGFGVADLLPVTFTVLVGVSMAWQLANHRDASTGWWALRLGRRVVLLVVAGVALAWVQTPDQEALRLTGPLVRLAAGGVLAWFVVTRWSAPWQAGAAGVVVVLHWFLLGRGVLGTGGAVARIEAWLFAGGGVSPVDPDGFTALAPTVVAVVAGVWIGRWLLRRPAGPATVAAFGLAGAYAVAGALAWAQILPVNATLWTGPTLLLGIGVTLTVLALAHLLVDVLPGRRVLRWVGAAGAEALPVYALAVGLGVALDRTPVGGLRDGLRDALVAPLIGDDLAVLATAALGTVALARVAVALADRGLVLRA